MLGCFNPNLGQIWTNPNGLKNATKKLQLEVKVDVGLKLNFFFNPTFGFVHILPKIGFEQPSIV